MYMYIYIHAHVHVYVSVYIYIVYLFLSVFSYVSVMVGRREVVYISLLIFLCILKS